MRRRSSQPLRQWRRRDRCCRSDARASTACGRLCRRATCSPLSADGFEEACAHTEAARRDRRDAPGSRRQDDVASGRVYQARATLGSGAVSQSEYISTSRLTGDATLHASGAEDRAQWRLRAVAEGACRRISRLRSAPSRPSAALERSEKNCPHDGSAQPADNFRGRSFWAHPDCLHARDLFPTPRAFVEKSKKKQRLSFDLFLTPTLGYTRFANMLPSIRSSSVPANAYCSKPTSGNSW